MKGEYPSRFQSWFIPVSFLLLFTCFIFHVITNNRWDWDHFYTGLAVDMSGWLTEFRPPTWSYQYCGGLSRTADPQSFGLSPLFLFILLFGPVAGIKILLIVMFPVGLFFLGRIFQLVMAADRQPGLHGPCIVNCVALMLLTSSYFLWQIVAGHVTQMFMYLVFGLLFLNLKGLTGRLQKLDFLWAACLGWCYFSGGIYHSWLYLWVPFVLAIYLAVAFQFHLYFLRRGHEDNPAMAFARVTAINALSVIPALYKLVPLAAYQFEHPRSGGGWDTGISPLSVALFQIFPTIGPHLSIGRSFVTSNVEDYRYSIWELGSFSPIPWVLLIVLLSMLWGKMRCTRASGKPQVEKRRWVTPLNTFLVIYALLSVAMVLGDFAPWSPYTLFNRYVLKNSAHISERFSINITLAMALLLVRLLGKPRLPAALTHPMLAAGVVASFVNFFLFFGTYSYGPYTTPYPAWLGKSKYTLSGVLSNGEVPPFSSSATARIREMVIYKNANWPPMYLYIREGKGFLNCYNPLVREVRLEETIRSAEQRLAGEPSSSGENAISLPVVEVPPGEDEAECINRSYLSQSRLHLDSSCPVGTCLNVNAVNPADPLVQYLSKPLKGRVCLTKHL